MTQGDWSSSTIRRRIKPMGVALAVTSVLVALGAWLAVAPVLGERGVFLFFLFATVVTALYGGFWPGLLALGLSAGLAGFVLLDPARHPEEGLYIGLFVTVGLGVVAVSRKFEGARSRLEKELVERGRVEGELREAARSREVALRAMAESESRFETMADRAPVMVWMTGADGLGEWFNRPWLSFTARSLEEELGSGWRRGVHPDDRERCLATYEAAFSQREPFEMEYRLRRGDGEYRWLVERGVARFASDGSFLGYVGSCLDITDRREVERRQSFLAAASDRLASSLNYESTLADIARLAIPEFADAAIAQLMVPGEDPQVEVAHADPDMERALREMEARYPSWSSGADAPALSESVLVGEVTAPILETRAQDEVHLRMLRNLRLRSFVSLPLKARNRSLGSLTLLTTISSGRRYTAEDVAFSEDLADRAALALDNSRLFREAHRASQQAREANRLKDDFLATLSHELRTPLAAIVSWTRLLGEGALGPAEVQKGIEVIDRNARLQSRLISDILDISRIVSGKMRLEVQAVDPAPVVESVLDTLAPAIQAKSIRVEPVLDPAAGPLSADPGRLHQVVWNLLSNAIKFTPPEGRIHVRLERSDSHVEFTVQDSGPGIDPAFLPHVFDRFRQADASSTRRQGGLGLGLAIVRHLVELHGGTVSATNLPGRKGAQFSVRLPRRIAVTGYATSPDPGRHVDEVPRSLPPEPSLAGMKVLIVDDEEDGRQALALALASRGADVSTAPSAAEGLRLLVSRRPHVVLADIGMPEEDGYALMRKIRKLGPEEGGRTPVVALTAYASAADRVRCFQAGFHLHIPKPVELGELVSAVARLGELANG
jgi:PAS domain S-box-containing protein